MIIKKIEKGYYTTLDGLYEITNEFGYWYANKKGECNSCIDSEKTLKDIKMSLESYIKYNN